VEQQAEDLANQKQEMARLLAQMDAERIKLEKQQLDARRLEARKFAKLLEEKEQILENVMQQMKADPSRRILAKSWNDIKLVKRDVLDEAENLPSVIAMKIAAEQEEVGELVPIAELRDKPDLKPGDPVVVCQKGPMFGRAGVVKSASGKSIVLKIQNMTLNLKTTEVALPNGSFRSSSSSSTSAPKQKNARERALEKALAEEGAQRRQQRTGDDPATPPRSKMLMRTSSNTVDCLGCTLMDAQERILDKFSTSTSGVVYVLHGHGTGGVLKSKIRNWLKSESAVASFQPADASNGGDALTCVVLK
jgi:DNA mismatch repair protein MutS2